MLDESGSIAPVAIAGLWIAAFIYAIISIASSGAVHALLQAVAK